MGCISSLSEASVACAKLPEQASFSPSHKCEMWRTCRDGGCCLGHCMSAEEQHPKAATPGWEIKEKWFHVRLENEKGQLASGSSSESYEEALFRARIEASTIKPPIYRTIEPTRTRPTINDL